MAIQTFNSVAEFTADKISGLMPVQSTAPRDNGMPRLPTRVPGFATQAINTAGANLGFGGVTPSLVGPTLPGTGGGSSAGALTSTSLGSVLGAAGIGAVGGGALAGITGGNTTGGSIGGALGSAAGSFAAGTATGTAIGTAVGIGAQALNFVLPGLGIIAGGLAGSLFGPSDPNLTSEFTSTIGANRSLQDIQVGTKHIGPEAAQYVATSLDGYLSRVQELTGLSFEGQRVRGGRGGGKEGTGFINLTASGTKGLDPYRETTHDVKRIEFDINKPDRLNDAMQQAALHLAATQGATESQLNTIRDIKFSDSSIQTTGQARSPQGVPLVDPARKRMKTKFEQFAADYQNRKNSQ